jgi:hypothetical protein
MPKKIKLTENTIHMIADRLRKFFQRNEYIALQNFYKKEPMSSEQHPMLSPFHCTEKSMVRTKKCAGIQVCPELWDDEELLLCIESKTSAVIYNVGDIFIFSPTHIKVKTKRITSFGTNAEKCTEIISSGNEQGYHKSIEMEGRDRRMHEEMMEEIVMDEELDEIDDWADREAHTIRGASLREK